MTMKIVTVSTVIATAAPIVAPAAQSQPTTPAKQIAAAQPITAYGR